jgi:hypothetical protein
MSLQGTRIITKVIEQMEQALSALQAESRTDPHGAKGKQDDRFRSVLTIKLAELQDEVEPIITGEQRVRAEPA